MGFRDWLKTKKKKRQQERMEKRQQEELAERSLNLAGNDSGFKVDPADINPPESRFTDEYREFLEKQESAAALKAEDVRTACEECPTDGESAAEDN